MHAWIIVKRGKRWFLSDFHSPTRANVRRVQNCFPTKTRIRKYTPEPTLRDFNTWFEEKYGTRYLYLHFASMSDDELSDRLYRVRCEAAKHPYPNYTSYLNERADMQNERDHREDWDSKREIAFSAFKATLSGFKEKP